MLHFVQENLSAVFAVSALVAFFGAGFYAMAVDAKQRDRELSLYNTAPIHATPDYCSPLVRSKTGEILVECAFNIASAVIEAGLKRAAEEHHKKQAQKDTPAS